MLLYQVHYNVVKLINICIANDGKHIEDFGRIKILVNKNVFVSTCVPSLWTPCRTHSSAEATRIKCQAQGLNIAMQPCIEPPISCLEKTFHYHIDHYAL